MLHLPGDAVFAQSVELLEVIIAKFDLLEVGDDAILLDTLGDNREAFMHSERNQNLRCGSTKPVGNLPYGRIVGELRFSSD